MKRLSPLIMLVILMAGCNSDTFHNPLLPGGADPWIFYHDGYYYYTNTLGDRLGLWKTTDITKLKTAEYRDVFIPPDNTPYSKELWAPEIMNIDGKWYFYFAADDGDHFNHRLFVLENPSPDPFQGKFTMKGQIVTDSSDNWAIDGSVFQQSPENSVYGTGHNCFFKSPDGTEDWILYHANDGPDYGCGDRRSPRAQPILWNTDGTPDFGKPISISTPINKPSGSR
jgi:GH43 family beta-xylosidase